MIDYALIDREISTKLYLAGFMTSVHHDFLRGTIIIRLEKDGKDVDISIARHDLLDNPDEIATQLQEILVSLIQGVKTMMRYNLKQNRPLFLGEHPPKEPVGTAAHIEQAFEDIRKMAKNESPK